MCCAVGGFKYFRISFLPGKLDKFSGGPFTMFYIVELAKVFVITRSLTDFSVVPFLAGVEWGANFGRFMAEQIDEMKL